MDDRIEDIGVLEDSVVTEHLLPFLNQDSSSSSGVLKGFILDNSQISQQFTNFNTNQLISTSFPLDNSSLNQYNFTQLHQQEPFPCSSNISTNNFNTNVINQNQDHESNVQLQLVHIPQRAIIQNFDPNSNINKTTTTPTIDNNKKTTDSDSEFKCPICSKHFSKLSLYNKHKLLHIDEKQFKCNISNCSADFNFQINYDVHMLYHEAERTNILKCKMCPESKFTRLCSLKTHFSSHMKDDDNLLCLECGDDFPTKARLAIHMEEHKIQTKNIFSCNLCKSTFNQASLLKEHSKTHNTIRLQLKDLNSKKRKVNDDPSDPSEKKKKKICEFCGKKFSKPSQLKRHSYIHSGEKPFQCNESGCGKSFNQKGTLENHKLSMHVKAKPYLCRLCNCKFSQKGNLRSHVLNVHVENGRKAEENEKVFKCQECSCIFKRLATLNNHISKSHSHSIVKLDPSLEPENENLTTETNQASAIQLNKESNFLQSSNKEADSISKEMTGIGNIPNQQQQNDESIAEANLVHSDPGKNNRCIVRMKRIGNKKYHLCPFCDKLFSKPSDTLRHIRTHTGEKPYSCSICQKSFAVKSTLMSHSKTHSQKEFECSICQKRFSLQSSLNTHMKIHENSREFSCTYCGKLFRTQSQRKVHELKIHLNSNSLSISGGRRRLLRIGDINTPVQLQDPLKITENGLVSIPNRSLSTLISAQSGIQNNERRYKCNQNQCLAAFKKSSHLKQHQRKHTGERPYTCSLCSPFRSFVSSGVLKGHIKNIHERIKNFTCIICQLTFTTNGSLKRHKTSRHSNERNFVCPYCHKTFKSSVACRKHIKIHRSDIVASEKAKNTSEINQIQPQINQSFENQYVATFDGEDFQVLEGQMHQHQQPTNVTLIQSNDPHQFKLTNDMNNYIGQSQGEPSALHHYIISGDQMHLIEEAQNQQNNTNQQQTMTLDYIPLDINQINNQQQQQHINFDQSTVVQQIPTTTTIVFNNQDNHEISQIANYVLQLNEQTHTEQQQQQQPDPLENISSSNEQQLQQQHEVLVEESHEIQNHFNHPENKNTNPDQKNGSTANSKSNQCQFCSRIFKKKSDLIRHTRIHTGQKPFICPTCNRGFRVKSTLEAHKKVHLSESLKISVTCPVCGNKFSSKSSLKCHIRVHTGEKPYKCDIFECRRNFRTSGHLLNHKRTSHSLQINQNQSKSNTTVKSLPPVETIKTNNDNIQIGVIGSFHHGSIDESSNSIQITGLDENFFQNLSNVIFLPNQENSQDDGCDNNSSNNINKNVIVEYLQSNNINIEFGESESQTLINQIPTPTAGKNIEQITTIIKTPEDDRKCSICSKIFCNKSARNRHEKIHSSNPAISKPHKCPVCFEAFSQKNILDSHYIFSHTNDKINCPLCEFGTCSKSSMRIHFSRAHQNSPWSNYEPEIDKEIKKIQQNHPQKIASATASNSKNLNNSAINTSNLVEIPIPITTK